jgi:CubicO group peptidase (beta-lactamase class C family)
MKAKRRQLQELFEALADKGHMNGAVLAAQGGEILYKSAFGVADLADGRKLTTGSVFELASLSKPFTAMGIVLLNEQGKLSYEDGVERWIPDFPYPGVTIRHLLCHTSGLPDYMGLLFEHGDRSKIADNGDVLRMLTEHRPPAYFVPNESWAYSNTGYVLLAIIAERVAGQPFHDYLRDSLFRPLGMDSTRIHNRRHRPAHIADYAYGYVYDPHTGRHELPDRMPETDYVVFLDGIQGDGTVNSNLDDLFIFDRALHEGSFVGKQALEQVFTPVRLNNGDTFHYGFGWILEQTNDRGRVVSHSGGWPGYATSMKRYIDRDMTLIYFGNMEQQIEYEQAVLEAAEHILFGEPFEIPERAPDKKAANIDTAVYGQYAGNYRFDSAAEMTASITIESGDRLYLQITGQVRFELYPYSPTRFFVRNLPVEIEFVAEAGSQAEKLVIYQDGQTDAALRID